MPSGSQNNKKDNDTDKAILLKKIVLSVPKEKQFCVLCGESDGRLISS